MKMIAVEAESTEFVFAFARLAGSWLTSASALALWRGSCATTWRLWHPFGMPFGHLHVGLAYPLEAAQVPWGGLEVKPMENHEF